jgi:CheY-like chemotaxis protein
VPEKRDLMTPGPTPVLPEVLAPLAEPGLPAPAVLQSCRSHGRTDREATCGGVKVTNLQVYDHAPMRTLCRVNLEAAGFRVLEAADGDEALALVRADRPDVILLDIMMPRVSGREVAAALLADHSADRIPIIFISAAYRRHRSNPRVRARSEGVRDEAFDPEGLAATVTKVPDQIDRGERDADIAETLAALKAEREAGSKTLRHA